jgi:hypothetical protein
LTKPWGSFRFKPTETCLERLGYDDGGAALWSFTLELVREHRPLIARVAIKLAREHSLSGADLDRIVGAAGITSRESACS